MESSQIFFVLVLLFSIVGFSFATPVEARADERIVGGEVIQLSTAPYQVSLQYKGQHMCGGSLISKTFVLTAAHCVYEVQARWLTVRLGTSRLGTGGEVISLNSVTIHPQYNPVTFNFDFALLKLSKSVKLQTGVKEIIELPELNEPVADRSLGIVSGWGDTMDITESRYFLRGVTIGIINQSLCRTVYSNLSKEMICAGDFEVGGVDACQGDSGGPLRQITDGKLIGVVSFGSGCALRGYPGVYSRVASVRTWIRESSQV